MKYLTVRHATHYRYAKPVSLGTHRLMLRPRDSHDLRLVGAELTLSPPGKVRWLHDVFSNSVALVDFEAPAAELSIGARSASESPAGVQAALWEERSLVKTWAMRTTLHLLPAGELPLYMAAVRRRGNAWKRTW